MDYVVGVEQRKVAVHCHAGLGRTGVLCVFVCLLSACLHIQCVSVSVRMPQQPHECSTVE